MDARLRRLLPVPLVLCFIAAGQPGREATVRSRNFVVTAPTAEIARQVADAAEVYRRELAIDWLGQELLPWFAPCQVRVRVGQLAASGETKFAFHSTTSGPDEVTGWDMKVQGSLERIMDSVLPHEVSHTIFACHFRRPLPRWADEGAATLIECDSERLRQVHTVRQVIRTSRRIPLKTLLTIKEYPRDMQDVMTLYAEGYSLADLLVQKGGKARFLKFINDANQRGWEKAIQTHYGFSGVDELESHWQDWVIAGSPELPKGQLLVRNDATSRTKEEGEVQIRGQSPSEPAARSEDASVELAVALSSPARPRRGNSHVGNLKSGTSRTAAHPRGRDETEWVPDDSAARLASQESEAEDTGELDDGHWVDVPRSRPAQRKAAERRQEMVATKSDPAEGARGPAKRESIPLPTAVRQRQARPATSWSEFPQ